MLMYVVHLLCHGPWVCTISCRCEIKAAAAAENKSPPLLPSSRAHSLSPLWQCFSQGEKKCVKTCPRILPWTDPRLYLFFSPSFPHLNELPHHHPHFGASKYSPHFLVEPLMHSCMHPTFHPPPPRPQSHLAFDAPGALLPHRAFTVSSVEIAKIDCWMNQLRKYGQELIHKEL